MGAARSAAAPTELAALKRRPPKVDIDQVSDEQSPLRYLNVWERRLLGPAVRLLMSASNARIKQSIETTGEHATVRMACVNALRAYAIVLFFLGVIAQLARAFVPAEAVLGLAAVCMAWSFWCLYTAVGPERDFKREHSI